jgi:hypothetical protein
MSAAQHLRFANAAVSEETRRRMSAAMLGHPCHASGWHHTDKARAAIGRANRGKAVSAETRAKLSAANVGRKQTAETRARMSVGNRAAAAAMSGEAKRARALRGHETRARDAAFEPIAAAADLAAFELALSGGPRPPPSPPRKPLEPLPRSQRAKRETVEPDAMADLDLAMLGDGRVPQRGRAFD